MEARTRYTAVVVILGVSLVWSAAPIMAQRADSGTISGVVTADRAFPFRWTFIIGGDGKILKVDKEVNPSMAGQDLVADLRGLGVN